jgi:hypothetical protein
MDRRVPKSVEVRHMTFAHKDSLLAIVKHNLTRFFRGERFILFGSRRVIRDRTLFPPSPVAILLATSTTSLTTS